MPGAPAPTSSMTPALVLGSRQSSVDEVSSPGEWYQEGGAQAAAEGEKSGLGGGRERKAQHGRNGADSVSLGMSGWK